jgi:hypothetical protein
VSRPPADASSCRTRSQPGHAPSPRAPHPLRTRCGHSAILGEGARVAEATAARGCRGSRRAKATAARGRRDSRRAKATAARDRRDSRRAKATAARGRHASRRAKATATRRCHISRRAKATAAQRCHISRHAKAIVSSVCHICARLMTTFTRTCHVGIASKRPLHGLLSRVPRNDREREANERGRTRRDVTCPRNGAFGSERYVTLT